MRFLLLIIRDNSQTISDETDAYREVMLKIQIKWFRIHTLALALFLHLDGIVELIIHETRAHKATCPQKEQNSCKATMTSNQRYILSSPELYVELSEMIKIKQQTFREKC